MKYFFQKFRTRLPVLCANLHIFLVGLLCAWGFYKQNPKSLSKVCLYSLDYPVSMVIDAVANIGRLPYEQLLLSSSDALWHLIIGSAWFYLVGKWLRFCIGGSEEACLPKVRAIFACNLLFACVLMFAGRIAQIPFASSSQETLDFEKEEKLWNSREVAMAATTCEPGDVAARPL